MTESNNNFIEETKQALVFLERLGFSRGEPHFIRDETSIQYSSPILMFLFHHVSSYGGSVYCVVGKPSEHYPSKALGLETVIDSLGVESAYSFRGADAVAQMARSIEHSLGDLIRGDLAVLEKIWSEKSLEDRLRMEKLTRAAVSVRKIGDCEFLELPNTEAVFTSEFSERWPGHDFTPETIWLVHNDKFEAYCDNIEQAMETAQVLSSEGD